MYSYDSTNKMCENQVIMKAKASHGIDVRSPMQQCAARGLTAMISMTSFRFKSSYQNTYARCSLP